MSNFDLDTRLIEFPSAYGTDYLTIRHAVSGIAIFGATSSGKSSGPGRLFAIKYLMAGFGGLVLTVKPDEVETWRSYCTLTGRLNDLIVIEPKGKHAFNILDYAAGDELDTSASTDNIVELLTKIIEAGQTQDSGKSNDFFWADQTKLLINNTIDLCRLAYNRVSVQFIYDIIRTIPQGEDAIKGLAQGDKAFHQAFKAAQENVYKQIDTWTDERMQNGEAAFPEKDAFEEEILEAIPDARLLKFVDGYFVDEFIPLAQKTRSIIQVSVTAFMFSLLREPFYSLFCKESTIRPEDCFDGKIVIINLPTKKYQKVGRDIQLAAKLIFIRAWEQRDVRLKPRPCFIFIDEAQEFLTEFDSQFLTTARSSRIATVFLSQNLSNYYSVMGGQKAEYRVRSLLGNFSTKIFHTNTEETTNEFASKLIGDEFFEERTKSKTTSEQSSQTRGVSLKLERVVRPEQFVNLRTGGPLNSLRVEGYIHRAGESFANGKNHIKTFFNQDYRPNQSVKF